MASRLNVDPDVYHNAKREALARLLERTQPAPVKLDVPTDSTPSLRLKCAEGKSCGPALNRRITESYRNLAAFYADKDASKKFFAQVVAARAAEADESVRRGRLLAVQEALPDLIARLTKILVAHQKSQPDLAADQQRDRDLAGNPGICQPGSVSGDESTEHRVHEGSQTPNETNPQPKTTMTTPPNTYRQWLVGQALQGLLASGHFTENDTDNDGPWYLKGTTEFGVTIYAVEAACRIADAAITEEKGEIQ